MITTKQLSDLAGVTGAAVSMAKKRGKLFADASGLYDPADPLTAAWIASARSRVSVAAAGRTLTDDPDAEDLDDGEAGEADGDGADSTLTVLADFGGGFVPIIKHRFTHDDLELDSRISPVPVAVEIEYTADGAIVRTTDGEVLPTRCESYGRGGKRLMVGRRG
jgi:hypothetical protein